MIIIILISGFVKFLEIGSSIVPKTSKIMAPNRYTYGIISLIEEYINYTGKVGCLEIPETHLFYYKEDEFSPPVWTGNSNRHG